MKQSRTRQNKETILNESLTVRKGKKSRITQQQKDKGAAWFESILKAETLTWKQGSFIQFHMGFFSNSYRKLQARETPPLLKRNVLPIALWSKYIGHFLLSLLCCQALCSRGAWWSLQECLSTVVTETCEGKLLLHNTHNWEWLIRTN